MLPTTLKIKFKCRLQIVMSLRSMSTLKISSLNYGRSKRNFSKIEGKFSS